MNGDPPWQLAVEDTETVSQSASSTPFYSPSNSWIAQQEEEEEMNFLRKEISVLESNVLAVNTCLHILKCQQEEVAEAEEDAQVQFTGNLSLDVMEDDARETELRKTTRRLSLNIVLVHAAIAALSPPPPSTQTRAISTPPTPSTVADRNGITCSSSHQDKNDVVEVGDPTNGHTVSGVVGREREILFGGWDNFNMEEEYSRMGLNDAWRLSTVNSGFKICDTYPEKLYVPAKITDHQLKAAARYRSKGRIPVLSYFNSKNSAVILRSAQPMSGLSARRCAEDEALFMTACKYPENSCSKSHHIMDARSRINAVANRAGGKGYETWSDYGEQCVGHFLEIENIHAMRNSLNALIEACSLTSQPPPANDQPTPDVAALNAALQTSIEGSKWLAHIHKILQGTNLIVNTVNIKQESVLVHCSDGWDRTAQLSALAQLMLDPYYRTVKGLKVLIQKEWLAFGHKFRDRFGHLLQCQRESSPVFLQFLDCIWQLMQHYPASFEFTELYLVELYALITSGQICAFMCNSDKERRRFRDMEEKENKRANSLFHNIVDYYNPQYDSSGPTVLTHKDSNKFTFFRKMYLPRE